MGDGDVIRVMFDTSVIVAALLEDHPQSAQSVLWLQQVKSRQIEGFISTHSLAEI